MRNAINLTHIHYLGCQRKRDGPMIQSSPPFLPQPTQTQHRRYSNSGDMSAHPRKVPHPEPDLGVIEERILL